MSIEQLGRKIAGECSFTRNYLVNVSVFHAHLSIKVVLNFADDSFCSIIFFCKLDIFRVISINVKFQVTCQPKWPLFFKFGQFWFQIIWLKMFPRMSPSRKNMFGKIGAAGAWCPLTTAIYRIIRHVIAFPWKRPNVKIVPRSFARYRTRLNSRVASRNKFYVRVF